MESRAKILGHPIHPMLIVFPLGLFVTAVVCDIIWLIQGDALFPVVSFYNISGGMIGGILAAVFGFRDYLAIPKGTRAKSVAFAHGIGNGVVLLLFFISWLIRRGAPISLPPVLAMVFSFAGIIVAGLTAWLGGELVDQLSVGVNPNANLNAPSSISRNAHGLPRMEKIPVTGENSETRNRPASTSPIDSPNTIDSVEEAISPDIAEAADSSEEEVYDEP